MLLGGATSYLSSNDSNILAQSNTSPYQTQTDTLQSNVVSGVGGKWGHSASNQHHPSKTTGGVQIGK